MHTRLFGIIVILIGSLFQVGCLIEKAPPSMYWISGGVHPNNEFTWVGGSNGIELIIFGSYEINSDGVSSGFGVRVFNRSEHDIVLDLESVQLESRFFHYVSGKFNRQSMFREDSSGSVLFGFTSRPPQAAWRAEMPEEEVVTLDGIVVELAPNRLQVPPIRFLPFKPD